jgi:hypothetical protein
MHAAYAILASMNGRHTLAICVAVGMMLVVYAGSYLAVLKPINERYWMDKNGRLGGKRDASYRFGGDLAECIFSPACRIDHWIRPGYWSPMPREGNIISLP